jgi:hypothetical protein
VNAFDTETPVMVSVLPDCDHPAGASRFAANASGSDNMNATMKSPSTVPDGLFTVREIGPFDPPGPALVATVEFRYEATTGYLFRVMPAAGRSLTGGRGGAVVLVIHPPRDDLVAISTP